MQAILQVPRTCLYGSSTALHWVRSIDSPLIGDEPSHDQGIGRRLCVYSIVFSTVIAMMRKSAVFLRYGELLNTATDFSCSVGTFSSSSVHENNPSVVSKVIRGNNTNTLSKNRKINSTCHVEWTRSNLIILGYLPAVWHVSRLCPEWILPPCRITCYSFIIGACAHGIIECWRQLKLNQWKNTKIHRFVVAHQTTCYVHTHPPLIYSVYWFYDRKWTW